jgi:microcystin-dependent protein
MTMIPDGIISVADFRGLVLPYAGYSAPTGWLLCDGSPISRTTYADLFALISTTYGAGDGSTTFNIPDMRGRAVIGAGTGTKVATFASRSSNVITVTGLTNAANNEFQTGQAVLYSAPSGAMTGLTHNTTYYLVRTGNLTFSLATTLANAQNGTVISLSSDGTGVQTFTLTLTARTLADTGGEENHAMSSTEILSHAHMSGLGSGGGAFSGLSASASTGPGQTSTSVGGNTAMNNMQPFLALNFIIKY